MYFFSQTVSTSVQGTASDSPGPASWGKYNVNEGEPEMRYVLFRYPGEDFWELEIKYAACLFHE